MSVEFLPTSAYDNSLPAAKEVTQNIHPIPPIASSEYFRQTEMLRILTFANWGKFRQMVAPWEWLIVESW